MQRAQTRLRPGQQFTKTNAPSPNLELTWFLYAAKRIDSLNANLTSLCSRLYHHVIVRFWFD